MPEAEHHFHWSRRGQRKNVPRHTGDSISPGFRRLSSPRADRNDIHHQGRQRTFGKNPPKPLSRQPAFTRRTPHRSCHRNRRQSVQKNLIYFYCPEVALSNGENLRSLASCILELFKKHWSAFYFDGNISMIKISVYNVKPFQS